MKDIKKRPPHTTATVSPHDEYYKSNNNTVFTILAIEFSMWLVICILAAFGKVSDAWVAVTCLFVLVPGIAHELQEIHKGDEE